MNATTEQKPSRFKNFFAILGFIILLIVGIWSAIQVVQFVPRLFSDTGVTSPTDTGLALNGEDIVVQVTPAEVPSGETVRVQWAHNGDPSEGILSFSYACVDGFFFQVAERPIPCNAPYTLPGTATTLDVVPVATKANTRTPLAVTYTNNDGESIRDTEALIVTTAQAEGEGEDTGTTSAEKEGTVSGASPEGQPVEPQPRTHPNQVLQPTVPAQTVRTIKVPRRSDPFGFVDLHVTLISLGEVNAYGTFTNAQYVSPYARGGAKFKVTNLGTKESGPWYFAATLPTQGGYPYNSQPQPSLLPGSSTEVVITFDQLYSGNHFFSVHVDPLNFIPELNELNNTASRGITVTNY